MVDAPASETTKGSRGYDREKRSVPAGVDGDGLCAIEDRWQARKMTSGRREERRHHRHHGVDVPNRVPGKARKCCAIGSPCLSVAYPPYMSALCGEKLAGLQPRVKAKSDLRRTFHQRFERVACMHVDRRRSAGRHKQ